MCSDATTEELKNVLRRAAKELLGEIKRLRCWDVTCPDESQLTAWAVLARGRVTDLVSCFDAVDLFVEERHIRKLNSINLPRDIYPVVYKPRRLRADPADQLAHDPSESRKELQSAVARLRPARSKRRKLN